MPFSCDESEKFYELNRLLGFNGHLDENDLELEESSNFKSSEKKRDPAVKAAERRPALRTTAATTTTPTTATTAAPRASLRTTSAPRRSTVKLSRRTTTPFQTRSTTTTAAPTTQAPQVTTSREEHLALTTFVYENGDSTTERIEIADTSTQRDNDLDFLLSDGFDGNVSTTIPFEDYVTTVRDDNQRIIPELVESSTNGQIIDSPETNAAAEVVKSIKQLQNILPFKSASTHLPLDEPRRNRFLFKADSIANRKKLFDKLNQSA